MINLDQERSVHARKQVKKWTEFLPPDRKQILSECHRLPVWLRVNGLIAFLLFADVENERRSAETGEVTKRGVADLRAALADWLTRPGSPVRVSKNRSLADVLSEDRTAYRRAFAEAAAYSNWLKRWADATLTTVVDEPKPAEAK